MKNMNIIVALLLFIIGFTAAGCGFYYYDRDYYRGHPGYYYNHHYDRDHDGDRDRGHWR